MPFAKKNEVQAGVKLVADGGFTCIAEGAILTVQADDKGELFVPCAGAADDDAADEAAHRHYIDGQLDDGDEYIGLTLASAE